MAIKTKSTKPTRSNVISFDARLSAKARDVVMRRRTNRTVTCEAVLAASVRSCPSSVPEEYAEVATEFAKILAEIWSRPISLEDKINAGAEAHAAWVVGYDEFIDHEQAAGTL